MKPLFTNLLPPLDSQEYEKLKADIQERGVQVPIHIDEDTGDILDGWTRYSICLELGIVDFPIETKKFDTEAEKRWHAVSLNINRRHLNKSQIAAYALMYYGPVETEKAKHRMIENEGGRGHVRNPPPKSEEGLPIANEMTAVIGKKVGVLKISSRSFKKIMKESPETFHWILKGEITAERAAYGAAREKKKKKKVKLDHIEFMKKLLAYIKRKRKENNDVKRRWRPEASRKPRWLYCSMTSSASLMILSTGTLDESPLTALGS